MRIWLLIVGLAVFEACIQRVGKSVPPPDLGDDCDVLPDAAACVGVDAGHE